LAKFLRKFAKSEEFVGVAHSAELQNNNNKEEGARARMLMLVTCETRSSLSISQGIRCAFQRARRLLFRP
jgi:hypothetical protein